LCLTYGRLGVVSFIWRGKEKDKYFQLVQTGKIAKRMIFRNLSAKVIKKVDVNETLYYENNVTENF